MTEQRYTRIKELAFQPQEDCPVQLEKGAILIDNFTNKCILQLKLRNGGDKTVKDAHLTVLCFNGAGDALGVVADVYQNVMAQPGAFFGSDMPIDLVSSDVWDVQVSVSHVAFANKSAWPVKFSLKGLLRRSVFLKALIPFLALGCLILTFAYMPPIKTGFRIEYFFAVGLPCALVAMLTTLLLFFGVGTAIYTNMKKPPFKQGAITALLSVLILICVIDFFITVVKRSSMFPLLSAGSLYHFILPAIQALLITLYLAVTLISLHKKSDNSKAKKALLLGVAIAIAVNALLSILQLIRGSFVLYGNDSSLYYILTAPNIFVAVALILLILKPDILVKAKYRMMQWNGTLSKIFLALLAAYYVNFSVLVAENYIVTVGEFFSEFIRNML